MATLIKPKMPDSHWYTRDAKAMHTVPTKDGNERPTWLTDAKKLNLLPSVTSILGIFNKEGLNTWKTQQCIIAGEKIKRNKNESDKDFCSRVRDAAFAQVDEASTFGTIIHKALEDALGGKPVDRNEVIHLPTKQTAVPLHELTDPVLNWIHEKGLKIVGREVTVANTEYGFGGTMDTAFTFGKSGFGVIDFKTRKTEPGKPIKAYEFQPAQIVAYGATYWSQKLGWPIDKVLDKLHGANVFISSTEPGRVEVIRYTPQLLRQEWDMVQIAAIVWRYLKGYDPRDVKYELPDRAEGEKIADPVDVAKEKAAKPAVTVTTSDRKPIQGLKSTAKKTAKKEPKKKEYTLDFGKHKGKTLQEAPLEYVEWLSGQKAKLAKDKKLKEAIDTFAQ